jgi:hypothetical protein
MNWYSFPYPLQNDGSIVTLVFGGGLFQVESSGRASLGGQHLDECPLHITEWWQPSDSCVWWRPVSGRELWPGLSGREGMNIHPSTDMVSAGDIGGCRCWGKMPNIQRELTSSFEAKLPWEGESVLDSNVSIRGNLFCLAREVVFWRCGTVSLLITQVKQRRACSAPGWVPATRYRSLRHIRK